MNGPYHILCVDDEDDILEVTKLCLEMEPKLRVSICRSGTEAIERMSSIAPDLILLDVMMPGMDGPATFVRLQGAGALGATPLVFMTARVQRAEIERYLKLGAVAVIPKPFDPTTLSSEVLRILEQSHL